MPIQLPHLELKDYFSGLALVVSVIGWIVSYLAGQRAYKRNFLHQLTDRARNETTTSIREAEDWLMSLSTWLSVAIVGDVYDWRKRREELRFLLQDRHQEAMKWATKLEDYRLVFPECEAIRLELHQRQLPIQQKAWDILSSVSQAAAAQTQVPPTERFLSKLNEALDLVMTQSALLDDLRVHLQNAALSSITGRSIPLRHPPDPSQLRLTMCGTSLKIIDGRNAGPSALPRGWPFCWLPTFTLLLTASYF